LVGVDGKSTWMLAEGDDAAGVARTIPLTDEILSEAFVAYGQKGEPLRPAHGFPIRLIMPGFEGNLNIKWLRRLKFGDQPWMTRWETARYTQLLANGKARQFQLRMETNSVITSPSGTMVTRPGYNRIMGLAWSGHGKITKIEVSTDAAKTWQPAKINGLALPKAQTRFQMDWVWDGKPTKIVSRSIDGKGNIQPDCASFIARMGTNALFHYNAQHRHRAARRASQRSPPISSAGWAVMRAISSCRPLAFSVRSRSSECFGRINMRGFLSSPLVVFGKGLKLTRNRTVGHGLGSAKQSLCCF
jgi:sulfane dehydrogenase subunit SoxC